MRIEKIASAFDGLKLEAAITVPEESPKGVIQLSHGMTEHKERYFGQYRTEKKCQIPPSVI